MTFKVKLSIISILRMIGLFLTVEGTNDTFNYQRSQHYRCSSRSKVQTHMTNQYIENTR